jgi:diguanylate cyclase (GGDEF)-like protein/PAS domain S-box-containing protein
LGVRGNEAKAGRVRRDRGKGSGRLSVLFEQLDRQLPIAVKVGIPLVAVTVGTTVMLGAYATTSVRRQLEAGYRAQLEQVQITVQTLYSQNPGDGHQMNILLGNVETADPLVYAARVYRPGPPPQVWASTNQAEVGRRATRSNLGPMRSNKPVVKDLSIAGVAVQETDVPLTLAGRPTAVLSLFTRLGPLTQSISAASQKSKMVVAFAVLIQALALGLVLWWAVLRRVNRLGRAASLVASGYMSVRLPEGDAPPSRDAMINVSREFDRMLRSVRVRTEQQSALATIGQRVLSNEDLAAVLTDAVRQTAHAMEVRFTSLLEVQPDEKALMLRAGEGWTAGDVGRLTVPLDAGSLAEATLKAESPVFSEDLGAERRFAVPPLFRGNGIVSSMTTAVTFGERPWGILGVHGTTPRRFTADDSAFLHSMANTVAEGIHRAQAKQALSGSEARTGAILQAALDSVLLLDDDGRIMEFNPAAEHSFGFLRGEIIGKNIVELVRLPGVGEGHPPGLSGYLTRGHGVHLSERAEVVAVAKDGREFPVEITITRVPSDGRPVYTAFLRDITERKKAEEQIAFLAYHDKLTQLPNRAMFEEHLDLALARSRRNDTAAAVLYMDLDNFKLVNDGLGHDAGDELLRQMSLRLREVTRDTDLVARQGGDEFLLLCADIEPPAEGFEADANAFAVRSAERVAERIHESLRNPFTLADTEFFVSASMGISVFPVDAQDAPTLLKNADAAMYRSKRQGPGGHVRYSAETTETANQLSFATRLRRAVEERQWLLHYQPIVDLATGDTVEVEALVRWMEPGKGMVPPGDFIPLAEEMGLIGAIGDWVLEEICRQSSDWSRKGIPLRIGFNLSPRQLWQQDLGQKILLRMESSGVDPSRVTVEVTESAAMSDPERTLRILNDLHGKGLHLAIDDFGTGYSSLSRLKHLPMDVLKIDRSFVGDLPGDVDAVAIVRAIIQMGRSLGLTPLAEGIETEEQWRFLVDNGCLLGQGYLFSKPVTAADIETLLRPKGNLHVIHGGESDLPEATNG